MISEKIESTPYIMRFSGIFLNFEEILELLISISGNTEKVSTIGMSSMSILLPESMR
jgi:hypothetical protein